MAALHTALKALGPVDFSDVPTGGDELDKYLDELFQQAELILESIPIPEPSKKTESSQNVSAASSASELVASSARSAAPSDEYLALQKQWGKPYKLGAKENALGMSVYKLSAKDGHGAWFARRSVHEGLGFSKFKKSLQKEFEQSLAVHGAPGEGNIRGIGGEERVEQKEVPGKGSVEVYRLSAQFPGPTTPRDFVTLLITSDSAVGIKDDDRPVGNSWPAPRHYMIISKPCNHPETQPRDGFIRGSYESVEFIREIPKPMQTSLSTTDLDKMTKNEDDIGRAATLRNAEQKTKSASVQDLTGSGQSRDRSTTEPYRSTSPSQGDADETNPVEWLMVTRSDPGGSVPRFMVERGTPSSICADAVKFVDWACQNDVAQENSQITPGLEVPRVPKQRTTSFQSFRSSRLAGVNGDEKAGNENAVEDEPASTSDSHQSGGIMGTVYSAASSLSTITPQVVLDHLPGSSNTNFEPSHSTSTQEQTPGLAEKDEDEKSIVSTTSFASAEDHLSSGEEVADVAEASPELSMDGDRPTSSSGNLSHHEKELSKLTHRRATLTAKFTASRSKLVEAASAQSARDDAAKQKAVEKHEKELKKHEEKFEKEVRKIDEKQKKEMKKLESKRRKEEDKDEKTKLTRERDEARAELDLVKKEAAVLRNVVEELQKENTSLVVKLGKLGLSDKASVGGIDSEASSLNSTIAPDAGGTRSRSNSQLRKKIADVMETKPRTSSQLGRGELDLGENDSAASSIKAGKS